MAQGFKHVGRIKASGRKCLIAFRTLPGDANSCLVILTENLHPTYHDALMSLVDTNPAQDAFEFADVLNRNIFPDGTYMLQSLHAQGLLTKLATDRVEVTPTASSSMLLSTLNELIAEQRGVSVDQLAVATADATVKDVAKVRPVADPVSEPIDSTPHVLSDSELAKKYRSDADRLSKEAASLRRMAEELAPTKKKKKESSDSQPSSAT